MSKIYTLCETVALTMKRSGRCIAQYQSVCRQPDGKRTWFVTDDPTETSSRVSFKCDGPHPYCSSFRSNLAEDFIPTILY